MLRFPVCALTLTNIIPYNTIVAEVIHMYNTIRVVNLLFSGAPFNVYVHRNELADTFTKFSLCWAVIVDVKVPFRDLQPFATSTVKGCGALTEKTTRNTIFNELVPTSTRYLHCVIDFLFSFSGGS